MNKKVSKTLAAVLSAAMAASAFAVGTGAAFAADTDNQISAKTVTASFGIGSDKTVKTGINLKQLVEGGSTIKNNAYKSGLQPTFTVDGVDYTGGKVVLDGSDWHAIGNDTSVVQINGDNLKPGPGAAKLDEVRTVKLEHTAIATSDKVGLSGTSQTQLNGQTVTVEIEVTVYPDDAYIILPTGTSTTATGENPASEATLSMNENLNLDTYQIDTDTNTGAVKFVGGGSNVGFGELAQNTTTIKGNYRNTLGYNSSNGVVSIDPNGEIKSQNPESVQTGSSEIKTTLYHNTANTNQSVNSSKVEKNDVIPFNVTIEDTYKVMNEDTDTFTANGGKTQSESNNEWNRPYDVDGTNIVVDSDAYKNGAKTINVGADAVVGDIDAEDYTGSITVTGTTGNITSDGTVNVEDNLNGYPKAGKTISAGNISADTINVIGTNKEGNVPYTYQTVETGDLKATNINITAYDNNIATAPVGYGHVVVKNITIKRDAQASGKSGLTLTAGKYVNTMTLGTISGEAGPYADSPFGAQVNVNQGTFSLGDLDKIGKVTIGTRTQTADVTVGKIDTGTVGNPAYVDSITNNSSIQVNAGSALTADSITTDKVLQKVGSGYSSITMTNTKSLLIKNDSGQQSSATSTYLYVPSAKAGDTLYTAYNAEGKNYIFMPVTGMDVLGQEGANKSYDFILQSIAFQGIRMTNSSVEVGEDPATLTLTALPDSAKLPDGVTVAWTATTDKAGKQTVKLTPSADGMTCQVEATGYTADNINGGNNVVVTATLMKDGKEYTDVAANTATANVTLTNKTAARPLTGISLNKTSTVMKPKETRQLTVSYAPEDTTDNKTVTWTSSDPAIATVDKNGLVTGVAYGKTTITAKVGDFTATCNVTISASGMIVKVTDLDGNVTECAPDGSTTVDIPQSTAYRVELTSDETINEFSYNAGNGKVGGTNTISVWNGTAGTYEAYAAGKPGEQTGFYVNGDKLFNMQVVTRPFVSDTTLTANVAVGKSYTFRITLNDKNAKFTFSTANGDAVATSYKKATYPDANGDYYCTVTTKKAVGNVGVYCNIDGKNYKVFAVNTRA